METIQTDYIVIGSGIAGLTCAKELASVGDVLVITKNKIKESATQYAQGGIAAALKEDDAPDYHFKDTIAAGDDLCDESAVRILVDEGPSRVQELISMGAKFDKYENGLSFTKEGAHSKRRILHAGDATGREIEKTLGNTLLSTPNVTFSPNTFVSQLHVKNNTVLGCTIIKSNNQKKYISAKAIVLATGGCGQIFAHNTNPPVATGDGFSLAYNAGAVMQDMEFVQFHPTTLYTGDKKPISIFLITEAIRGEGAILRNTAGERFMDKYDSRGEMAPRDIVARAIFNECKTSNSTHVYLDLSQIKLDVAERFPTIYKRCLEAKIDIKRDFIPVAPAAHYFMGGVKTDLHAQTSVNRLYAGGEVSCVGVHGANRLASNSLLDGLVFGCRAARHIIQANYTQLLSLPLEVPSSTSKSSDVSYLKIKQAIRELMWEHVAIIRNSNGLKIAISELQKHTHILKESVTEPLALEVQNMLTTSLLIAQFALNRTESRGSHFRSDFPEKNKALSQVHFTQARPHLKSSTH